MQNPNIIILSGGNNSGKTLISKMLRDKLENLIGLNVLIDHHFTVYENFSQLVYGEIREEFILHLKKIKNDVSLDRPLYFSSDTVSFGFYLKVIVSLVYGLNFKVLLAETKTDKETRDRENLRKYLIEFAEYAKIYDSQIWAKALFRLVNLDNFDYSKILLINDLRSLPEIESLVGLGVPLKMINLVRNNVTNIDSTVIDFAKNNPLINFTQIENNGPIDPLIGMLVEMINYMDKK